MPERLYVYSMSYMRVFVVVYICANDDDERHSLHI